MVPPHQAHRFGNITVIADDDGTIVSVKPAVVQQMYCQIDIGAFLFRPEHFRRTLVSYRLHKWSLNPVPEKVPEVYLYLGTMPPKGSQINVLTLRLRLV